MNTNAEHKQDPWNGIIMRAETPVEPPVETSLQADTPPIEEIERKPEEILTDTVSQTDLPPEIEEHKEPNPYFYLSSQLKKDGFLLDEFEAKEDVSAIEVYEAYRHKMERELEPQITKKVYSQLAEEGVNEEDLIIARAIRTGVDPSYLSEVSLHERFGSLDERVATREQKVDSLRSMYQSRGFSQKEIEKLVSTATDNEDEELDDYFKESKVFHIKKWNDFKVQEDNRIRQEKEQTRASLEYAEKIINQVFSSKSVLGEKLSDQESAGLREAIYSTSDKIEFDGKEYAVSKLYKFNNELNTNPELKLWLFKKYLFRDKDTDTLKKEVSNTMEKDMLKAYEASVKKDLTSQKNKVIEDKLKEDSKSKPEEKNYARSFMVEFG